MQEIRHLVFNRQEVQEIASSYLEERGDRAEAAGATWELGGERDGIRLTLTPAPAPARGRTPPASMGGRPPDRGPAVLTGGELLSATILFCKRRRIPLPVRGQKQIGIMRGSLALVIAMRAGE